ncbi:MAG TPA: transporter [Vicinamibacterales bacterium]|nr:transporter [Vicinamibacterales bacterium]
MVGIGISTLCQAAEAQIRGVYPTGMNATNAGVTPASGFTYSNLFIFNARDKLMGPDGEVLATGTNAVMIDLNTFVWVSQRTLLGGARLSATATLLVSNNSLASDAEGQLSAGGGFADSFYQPFILGWQTERVGIRTAYGFLAPTGRFNAGASDNVGSGYWTNVPSVGATVFLDTDKRTTISAFHMYEFHTTQEGTGIHPGQTANTDYSIARAIEVNADTQLQLGLVGYNQWQTTDKSGPAITAAQGSAHYQVNALGFASNVSLPARRLSLGLKYFKEFSNRSTFQGYTLQIAGAVTF